LTAVVVRTYRSKNATTRAPPTGAGPRGRETGKAAPLSDQRSCVTRHPRSVSYVMEHMGQQAHDRRNLRGRSPTYSSEKEKGKAGARTPQGPTGLPPSRVVQSPPTTRPPANAPRELSAFGLSQGATGKFSPPPHRRHVAGTPAPVQFWDRAQKRGCLGGLSRPWLKVRLMTGHFLRVDLGRYAHAQSGQSPLSA
jgi:hypothetical protein